MNRRGGEEVDWDRLDKKKFYIYGAGLFSGVTLILFPATVIKTRQMASSDVPAGFKGAQQTAQTIWRSEGMAGFYRGLPTVVFGTIPARVVYLSTLEFMKSSCTKVCRSLEWSEPGTAALANFVGGASASLATQAVTVPIDVVSQRQMVYNTTPANTTSGQSRAAGPPVSTPAGPPVSAPAGSTGTSSTSPQHSPLAKSAPPTTSRQSYSTMAASHRHPPAINVQSARIPLSPYTQLSSHLSEPSKPKAGLHSLSIKSQPLQTGIDTRTVLNPTGSTVACGSTQSYPNRTCTSSSGSAAAGVHQSRPPPGARGSASISGTAMARLIVKQEGVLGLYRGFGASLATYAPTSAVWWGAYGLYQKLIWSAIDTTSTQTASVQPSNIQSPTDKQYPPPQLQASSSSSSSSSTPAAAAITSTTTLVAVQVVSALCAGLTSATATNPLDLIKTRLQVARREQGVELTFWSVAKGLVAEGGVRGLWRGVAPRMVSSAMWGTAMVTTYEFLKRICKLPEPDVSA